MTPNLKEIAHRVDTIKKRNPSYGEMAQWVGELLSETVRADEKFNSPVLNRDQGPLPDAWSKGRPILDLGTIRLDWKGAGAVYRRLVRLVEAKEKGGKQVAGLMQALAMDRKNSHKLMKSALTSDFETLETAARELGVDPALLSLLLRMSLRPTLLKVARAALDRLDLSQWTHGHCPVCGSAPKLADLSGEGGKRRLYCSLCETAWPYPRLRCPFCENDNPESLRYLRAENEQGLRVDICTSCSNYIKTIDLRDVSGPVIVPLDDATTWHLDLIAQRKE